MTTKDRGEGRTPLNDLYDAMSMSNEGTAPRSEVQGLPVIALAREGDAKALEYLRNWGEASRESEAIETGKATYSELWAYILEDLRALRLEKRKRELTGGTA